MTTTCHQHINYFLHLQNSRRHILIEKLPQCKDDTLNSLEVRAANIIIKVNKKCCNVCAETISLIVKQI